MRNRRRSDLDARETRTPRVGRGTPVARSEKTKLPANLGSPRDDAKAKSSTAAIAVATCVDSTSGQAEPWLIGPAEWRPSTRETPGKVWYWTPMPICVRLNELNPV